MNCITLIGRLGADPDIKFFDSGSNIAKFSIAVDRPTRNSEKQADWFSCEAWGKTAQVIADYCGKGRQIAVTGRVEFESWQDKKTGDKRSKPVVKVDRIQMLGSSNGGESQHTTKSVASVANASSNGDDYPVF